MFRQRVTPENRRGNNLKLSHAQGKSSSTGTVLRVQSRDRSSPRGFRFQWVTPWWCESPHSHEKDRGLEKARKPFRSARELEQARCSHDRSRRRVGSWFGCSRSAEATRIAPPAR